MRTVGLTGGIACGKSTVAEILRGRGVPVLDADQVARAVVQPGSPALAEIVARFGAAVLRPDGALDRAALRRIVAVDAAARQDLEAMTHPRIGAGIQSWLAGQAEAGTPVAAVEAALMVETGSHARYDRLLVVACSPPVQLERLMARDHLDEAAARRWLAAQLPVTEKVSLADAVVWNEGAPASLPSAVDAAWRALGLEPIPDPPA